MIRLLCRCEADFVIVGGLAVRIQGGTHITDDVDFAIVRRRENAKKIAAALEPYHPRPEGFPPELPYVWDEEALMRTTVLVLKTDLCRVDFLAEPDGAPPYAELKARATKIDFESWTVYVASIDDLISMKRAAGRPKDLAHVAELETIKRLIAEERDA